MRDPVLSRKRHTLGSSCPNSLTPSSWLKGSLLVLLQLGAQPDGARDKAPRAGDRSSGEGHRNPGTGDVMLTGVAVFSLGDSCAPHHAGEWSVPRDHSAGTVKGLPAAGTSPQYPDHPIPLSSATGAEQCSAEHWYLRERSPVPHSEYALDHPVGRNSPPVSAQRPLSVLAHFWRRTQAHLVYRMPVGDNSGQPTKAHASVPPVPGVHRLRA